jgi:hypothetical protein
MCPSASPPIGGHTAADTRVSVKHVERPFGTLLKILRRTATTGESHITGPILHRMYVEPEARLHDQHSECFP